MSVDKHAEMASRDIERVMSSQKVWWANPESKRYRAASFLGQGIDKIKTIHKGNV